MQINKKTVYGILLIATLSANLFLTLQSPEGTVGLSEGLRLWLEQLGFHSNFHSFRSNAHLIVYLVIGTVLTLYGRENGWEWWQILLLGFVLGFLDEGMKVFLPTREFDIEDLVRDCIGIGFAVAVMSFMNIKAKER